MLDEAPVQVWRAPFVGRRRELAALIRQLDETEQGHSAIVLLSGEPGIGKTRIAEELCATAERRGARIFWGQCFEGEGAPAFWPWVQVVRTWVRDHDSESLAALLGPEAVDLAQIVPDVRARLPDLPEAVPLPPTHARFRLFDSIATVLQRLATGPLVLVLDDLHWADEPSLRLLEFLAMHVAEAPILIVGSYRDVDVTPGDTLSSTLGDLARRRQVHRLALTRLSPDEVAELVEATPGIRPVDRLVETVLDRAEGNPLFVGELLRLLHIEHADPAASIDVDRAVPPTIQDVIGRRLGKLSDSCRQVLTVASIVGRDFDLATLRAVLPGQDDQTFDALEEAEAARVIAPVTAGGAGGAFRFTHVLVRDSLYEALSVSRRTRLHLRVGTALDQLPGPPSDARLAELAHHYAQAAPISPPEQVVGHVERAARRSFDVLAYEDAARWYALGLQILEASPTLAPETRCQLLLQLGAAQSAMTDDLAATESFAAAAALARTLAPSIGTERAGPLLAQAALGYGGMARLDHRALDARGVGLLEEALAAVGDSDSALRAQLLARLRTATTRPVASAADAPSSLESIEQARRLGDPRALADAILQRIYTLSVAERLTGIPDLLSELETVATRLGDPNLRMFSKRIAIKYWLEAGDLTAADATVAAYEQVMVELRFPHTEWRIAVARMSRALLVGDFEAAERAAEEAASLGPRQPRKGPPWYTAGELHLVRIEQGRLDEAERLLDGLRRDYPEAPGPRAQRAWLLSQCGAVDARSELEALTGPGFPDLLHGGVWNYTLPFLSLLCADLGDQERAGLLYETLLPQAGTNIVVGIPLTSYGAVSYYLARLAATLGWAEVASRHFEEALDLHERLQARPLLAHTCLQYAAALLAGSAAGTPDRAQALAQRALEEASVLGMPIVRDRAAALVEAASAKLGRLARERTRYPDGLTAREVEVLALLANGATNPEIARRLVLSLGTVRTHTIKIYQKIGVRGRAEATIYATEHGLTDQ